MPAPLMPAGIAWAIARDELLGDEALLAAGIDVKPVAGVLEDSDRGARRENSERGKLRARPRPKINGGCRLSRTLRHVPVQSATRTLS
jgi:hypothetical protein